MFRPDYKNAQTTVMAKKWSDYTNEDVKRMHPDYKKSLDELWYESGGKCDYNSLYSLKCRDEQAHFDAVGNPLTEKEKQILKDEFGLDDEQLEIYRNKMGQMLKYFDPELREKYLEERLLPELRTLAELSGDSQKAGKRFIDLLSDANLHSQSPQSLISYDNNGVRTQKGITNYPPDKLVELLKAEGEAVQSTVNSFITGNSSFDSIMADLEQLDVQFLDGFEYLDRYEISFEDKSQNTYKITCDKSVANDGLSVKGVTLVSHHEYLELQQKYKGATNKYFEPVLEVNGLIQYYTINKDEWPEDVAQTVAALDTYKSGENSKIKSYIRDYVVASKTGNGYGEDITDFLNATAGTIKIGTDESGNTVTQFSDDDTNYTIVSNVGSSSGASGISVTTANPKPAVTQTTSEDIAATAATARANKSEEVQAILNEPCPMSEADAIAAGYSIVKTAEDLQNMYLNLDGKYILMNDIDMSNVSHWYQIGWDSKSFTGVFNGNGFEIKNFTYTRDHIVENGGLFGVTDGAVIKNVKMTNAYVDVSASEESACTGILVGLARGTAFDNIDVQGTVKGVMYVGGVVGAVEDQNYVQYTDYITGKEYIIQDGITSFNNVNANVNLEAKYNCVGGIAGFVSANNADALVEFNNCQTSGTASGKNVVAGIVGNAGNSIVANNVSSDMTISRNDADRYQAVGGLFGTEVKSANLTDCTYTGTVNGNTTTGLGATGVDKTISVSLPQGTDWRGTVDVPGVRIDEDGWVYFENMFAYELVLANLDRNRILDATIFGPSGASSFTVSFADSTNGGIKTKGFCFKFDLLAGYLDEGCKYMLTDAFKLLGTHYFMDADGKPLASEKYDPGRQWKPDEWPGIFKQTSTGYGVRSTFGSGVEYVGQNYNPDVLKQQNERAFETVFFWQCPPEIAEMNDNRGATWQRLTQNLIDEYKKENWMSEGNPHAQMIHQYELNKYCFGNPDNVPYDENYSCPVGSVSRAWLINHPEGQGRAFDALCIQTGKQEYVFDFTLLNTEALEAIGYYNYSADELQNPAVISTLLKNYEKQLPKMQDSYTERDLLLYGVYPWFRDKYMIQNEDGTYSLNTAKAKEHKIMLPQKSNESPALLQGVALSTASLNYSSRYKAEDLKYFTQKDIDKYFIAHEVKNTIITGSYMPITKTEITYTLNHDAIEKDFPFGTLGDEWSNILTAEQLEYVLYGTKNGTLFAHHDENYIGRFDRDAYNADKKAEALANSEKSSAARAAELEAEAAAEEEAQNSPFGISEEERHILQDRLGFTDEDLELYKSVCDNVGWTTLKRRMEILSSSLPLINRLRQSLIIKDPDNAIALLRKILVTSLLNLNSNIGSLSPYPTFYDWVYRIGIVAREYGINLGNNADA